MTGAIAADARFPRARSTAVAVMLALGSVAAEAAPKEYSDEEVAAAVRAVIAERTKDGVFQFTDPRTGETLALVFDDVRLVRGLPVFGWFPNVSFHDKYVPAKKYALDFWLKPDGDQLKLQDVRIHKAPKQDGESWMSVTRAPLAWWWLPTMKRQSAVAGMAAWQVMGTIQSHIAATTDAGMLKLENAGEGEATLQFVDVEQPVGKAKADGRYFACGLLRKFGTEPTFYSTVYWLDAKTKLVTAGSAKRLEEPLTGGSKAAAEPRCDVGGIPFDVVD
jgi:hypothetical protein